jgi:hypothetical protein
MLRNTYMKIFVASGYYDMATPFFGTEYTLSHLGVPESLRDNLRVEEYEAGHMMCIHEGSLAKMKATSPRSIRRRNRCPAGAWASSPEDADGAVRALLLLLWSGEAQLRFVDVVEGRERIP